MKHVILILCVIFVVLAIVYVVAQRAHAPIPELYDDMTPPQSEDTRGEDIVVTLPQSGAPSVSPMLVRGEARGTWFFEATLPIVVVDWDGRIIGEGYAQAEGEWMTENFVPFSGTVTFTTPEYGERGTVIFRKNNPSGLAEHDDAIEIPITFTK